MIDEMYGQTVEQLRGRFDARELRMVLDVMNGVFLEPHTVETAVVADIADSFQLYPGVYEEKWGVEQEVMMEKITSLSPWEAACLACWAAEFWRLTDRDLDGYILGGEKENPLRQELESVIGLLEKTRPAFKSALVAEARERLERVVEGLDKG